MTDRYLGSDDSLENGHIAPCIRYSLNDNDETVPKVPKFYNHLSAIHYNLRDISSTTKFVRMLKIFHFI
jgi:hypothetical protein